MTLKPGVEIILSGGLGNQLFQYAFGRWLSAQQGRPLTLNTYRLSILKSNETPRAFALRDMKLNAEVINEDRLVGKSRYLDHALKKFPFSSYCFEENNLLGNNFWGHWLNMKYANEVRSELLQEINFVGKISTSDLNIFEEVATKKILSIHIRRGDYVSNPKAHALHGSLDENYYKRAMIKANELTNFDDVWCFTDDRKWCESKMGNIKFITLDNTNPFLDLILMSKCHGNIISNSTFSWWAAWLNPLQDKLVIMPNRWYRQQKNPDIYPDSWIKMDNQ